MINLLPDNAKRQIRAGRINVILVRYIIIVGFAFVFLAGISVGAYMLLTTIKNNAQAIIDSNQTKANQFGTVQEDASALKTSLTSAKTLFDQEINYPKILTTLGSLVPDGVVIEKLTLNAQTLALPFDIQTYAKTPDDAAALQAALEGSPLFSGVSMKSLSSTNGLADYPVNAVITATINKEAAR